MEERDKETQGGRGRREIDGGREREKERGRDIEGGGNGRERDRVGWGRGREGCVHHSDQQPKARS